MPFEARTFEDKPATRERVPLMIGLMGPSGGGKTYSALRLATGIQRVTGGEIYMVDTEARRGLHYADKFKFRHLAFGAPFSPLDYLAAIEHCVKRGAGVIVVDSMSHEHEGPGGVLEWHEAEVDRMGGRESDSFRAWAAPKAARRRMINTVLQFPCNFVFCFRAKEKSKPGEENGKKKLMEFGYMPIAGEEFVFEMTANALLLPNAGGVPTWQSDFRGEKQMIKRPAQFAQLFEQKQPLSEDIGEAMAKWAEGSAGPRENASKPQGAVYRRKEESEWNGKPLADVPLDVLTEYATAIDAAIRANGRSPKALSSMQTHLAEVNDVIADKEAAP